jgi:hypothetical protein
MAARGGKIGAGAGGRGSIDVNIRVEGVAKTSQEFKDARRGFNRQIRDVMVKVGTREILPLVESQLPSWARMYVLRERSGVFIGSRQRGPMNRALGWWDFGGRRPMDSARRTGPHVIVKALDRRRDHIDRAVLDALLDEFKPLDTSKSL